MQRAGTEATYLAFSLMTRGSQLDSPEADSRLHSHRSGRKKWGMKSCEALSNLVPGVNSHVRGYWDIRFPVSLLLSSISLTAIKASASLLNGGYNVNKLNEIFKCLSWETIKTESHEHELAAVDEHARVLKSTHTHSHRERTYVRQDNIHASPDMRPRANL